MLEQLILGASSLCSLFWFPIEWLGQLDREQWVMCFWPLLFLDTPRYLMTDLILLGRTLLGGAPRTNRAVRQNQGAQPQPTVSVIISALNEEASVRACVQSVLAQDYPNLDIILLDDGSTDQTAIIGTQLAKHQKVRFFRLSPRQGKSAAVNFGCRISQAPYLVWLDSDSILDPKAITEVMRPFQHNARIGAVCGNIGIRNWRTNIVTRLQSMEYLCSIGVGRQIISAAGLLCTVSGAFGVFRRDLVERIGWFEPGTGEDTDMTIRIRKLGHDIAFAPNAVCLTAGPESISGFIRQRLRWDRAIVLFMLRKYRDTFSFTQDHFRIRNGLAFLDVVFFQIVLPMIWMSYLLWLVVIDQPEYLTTLLLALYYLYTLMNLADLLLAWAIEGKRARRFGDVCFVPLLVFYRMIAGFITMVATVQEFLFRTSYHDPYTPEKVREQMPVY